MKVMCIKSMSFDSFYSGDIMCGKLYDVLDILHDDTFDTGYYITFYSIIDDRGVIY